MLYIRGRQIGGHIFFRIFSLAPFWFGRMYATDYHVFDSTDSAEVEVLQLEPRSKERGSFLTSSPPAFYSRLLTTRPLRKCSTRLSACTDISRTRCSISTSSLTTSTMLGSVTSVKSVLTLIIRFASLKRCSS
jgi:hypothetical protein